MDSWQFVWYLNQNMINCISPEPQFCVLSARELVHNSAHRDKPHHVLLASLLLVLVVSVTKVHVAGLLGIFCLEAHPSFISIQIWYLLVSSTKPTMLSIPVFNTYVRTYQMMILLHVLSLVSVWLVVNPSWIQSLTCVGIYFMNIRIYISGGYDPVNPRHHELMCSLIMTCSDISDTCKEWETAKSIAVSLVFCFLRTCI